MIHSDYLIPNYDITFSKEAEKYKRRNKNLQAKSGYCDFQLHPNTAEPIIFFGVLDYIDLFCQITKSTQGTRYVLYNSKIDQYNKLRNNSLPYPH